MFCRCPWLCCVIAAVQLIFRQAALCWHVLLMLLAEQLAGHNELCMNCTLCKSGERMGPCWRGVPLERGGGRRRVAERGRPDPAAALRDCCAAQHLHLRRSCAQAAAPPWPATVRAFSLWSCCSTRYVLVTSLYNQQPLRPSTFGKCPETARPIIVISVRDSARDFCTVVSEHRCTEHMLLHMLGTSVTALSPWHPYAHPRCNATGSGCPAARQTRHGWTWTSQTRWRRWPTPATGLRCSSC